MKYIWQFLGLTQETIGRRRFLIAFFTAQWGLPLAVLLLVGLLYQLFGDEPVILYPMLLAFIASLVFGLVVYIKISIRRVRDIGIARSWWVLAIIPLINLPFFIYLCLKKGTTRQFTDDSKTNPLTQQFKLFFAKSYSKPFMVICFGVIVLGAIHAGSTVSNLKQDIDTKLAQRKEELNKLFDEKDKGYEVARQMLKAKNDECWNDFKNNRARYDVDSLSSTEKYLTRNSVCGSVQHPYTIPRKEFSYLGDDSYAELTRIKNTSSIQLFIDNFGFGWWGIIALVAVFLINILIGLFKFSKRYVPLVVGAGGARAALTKTNIRNMPPFHRYILLIALLILITLAFILMKL